MRRVTLVLLMLALVATAGPAEAVFNGLLTGRVTSSHGDPVSGACVEVYSAAEPDVTRRTRADDLGTFRFTLPPGTYKIFFDGDSCEKVPGYVSEWYRDAASAADAEEIVIAGDDVVAIQAEVSLGGTISGTVTDGNGWGSEGMCAILTNEDGEERHFVIVDPYDGAFVHAGLRPGRYFLLFDPCLGGRLVAEWWMNAPDFASATPIDIVGEEVISNIDAELAVGGRIEGVVVTDRGAPAWGSYVRASDGDREFWGFVERDGTYRIAEIAPGTYRIAFCCSQEATGYDEIWYGGTTYDTATVFDMSEGRWLEGIDAVIRLGPTADLAIEGLRVDTVPLQTDEGNVGHVPTQRRVRFDVANLGDTLGGVYLYVEIRSASGNYSDILTQDTFSLFPGASRSFDLPWDATGSVGDFDVRACIFPTRSEADYRNNLGTARAYVGVGGTGMGYGPGTPTSTRNFSVCDPEYVG